MVSIKSEGSRQHIIFPCSRGGKQIWFLSIFLFVVFLQMILTSNQSEEHFSLLTNAVATEILNSTKQADMISTKYHGGTGALIPLERDNKLPPWMIEYFEWHQNERREMNVQNWDSGRFHFLIMRCLKSDGICGGTSDRLQSLPFQLLLAHLSNRILLILWEKPFPLEEFLLPPKGGLDWRVPSFMADPVVQKYNESPLSYAPTAKKRILTPDFEKKIVVWVRDQTHNHGKSDYDQHHEQTNESSRFEAVFHDVWRIVFTPSPPVASEIEYWMTKLGLVPGEYASTHVRALYGVHNRSKEQIEEWTQNAIHCTTELRPQGPFFFASDSTHAQIAALEYGKKVGLQVVSRFHDTEPLHMDGNSTGRTAKEYYDVLVDLYLLGNARALAYNVGGYGKLGLIMGFDSSAGVQHQKGGVPWAKGITGVTLRNCNLKRPEETENNQKPPPVPKPGFFFAKPMGPMRDF